MNGKKQLQGALALALLLVSTGMASAGVLLTPIDAPDWRVSEWINGDPGDLARHRGRVIMIEFFQLWCPGCNSFSIPLFKRWHNKYGNRDDALVLSIHSVFEGHDYQTPQRLRQFIRDQGIVHPVGIDAYRPEDSETPISMHRFQTDGTPHIIIIDPEGKIGFSHFGAFDPAPVEAYIERMLADAEPPFMEPLGPQTEVKRRQTARPGQPGPGTIQVTKSGRYALNLSQFAKTCGDTVQGIEVEADLSVFDNRIEARFDTPYLGVRQINANYKAEDGTFRSRSRQRALKEGVGFSLDLELNGSIDLERDPPFLRFRFLLKKRGDKPGWDCEIQGRGTGRKLEDS